MFIRATRYVYVVLLWLYLAAILFQIFLAGLVLDLTATWVGRFTLARSCC